MYTKYSINRVINNPYLILDIIPSLFDWAKENGGLQKYIKMDDETASGISELLHIILGNFSSIYSADAYRLEFPEGLAGALAQQSNGYVAMLEDPKTGRIISQGTLFPVKAPGVLTNLFSALSVVTNQYYLHQIGTQLNTIQTQLDRVLEFLYDDKACRIYAEATAVMGIYRNYASIMACSEQRIASIQTIQQARIFAEQNIQFYYRDMNSLVDKNGPIDRLRDDLYNYTQAINLYGICAITEIVLSRNYDEAYLSHVEKDLRDHVTLHNQCVAKLQGKLEKNAEATAGLPLFQQKPDPQVVALIEEITSILGDQSPVNGFEDIIKQIRESMTDKTEYIVGKNGAIYQHKA